MNFPQSLDYLATLGWELRPGRKFDLAEIAALLGELGHRERQFASVHIAGTNGKGSVAALIESAARASGLRSGLYTSPHLQRVTERVRIAGAEISPADFARAASDVRAAAEALFARGALPHLPSFFEALTALGFTAFARAKIELAVVEVGLGGRLDATNVLHPRVAVITPIGMDHEQYLGTSLSAIATEKAGIIKPGIEAVVTAPQAAEVMQILRDRCRAAAVPLYESADPALELPLTLRGPHQRTNAACAALACEHLGLSPAAIRAGFRDVVWPGRLERVATQPEIFLDGAHNPMAARALAAYLDERGGPPPVLIYGTMRDKAFEEICGILFPRAAAVVLTAPRQPRAATPEELLTRCGQLAPHAETAPDFSAALAAALRLAGGSIPIFVTGSLYLVGEARDHWFPS